MPELPEVQAHAERLDEWFTGREFAGLKVLNFAVLKTAVPDPASVVGQPLRSVGRRGKYLLVEIGDITFAVHLMQAGRLHVDTSNSLKPRGGLARFVFTPRGADESALLLTEAGKERKAGIWAMRTDSLGAPPLDRLGIDALEVSVPQLAELFAAHNMRVHGFLRDQHHVCGLGRMLANEICHRARISPFAMTRQLGTEGASAIHSAMISAIDDGLADERTRTDMSSSADRPGLVHGRVGQSCTTCDDTIRSVSYSGYTVAYCPTCQTEGRVLADNTTSKFLR
ncbi:MAG: DNA-formamidopyrimidine glycosylase family protein [Ilumatobacteraceae bacterium]